MKLAQPFGVVIGVVIAVVIATLTLVGPAGAAAKSAPPESCRLLRAAEIADAFAQPAAASAAGLGRQVCDWRLSATDSRPAGLISVYLKRGAGATDDFDLARDFTGTSRVKLSGLGRRAFYAPGFNAVYVLRDPATILFVQGLYPDGAVDGTALQSALVGLAGKAAHRV